MVLDSASAWLITVVDWKSHYHHTREFGGVQMHYAVFFAPGGIAFHEGPITIRRPAAFG